MDTATIVIIIGLVVGAIWYFKARGNLMVAGVAAIMIGAGILAPAWVNDLGAGLDTTPAATVVSGLEFRIDVVNGTTGLGNTTTVEINDAETIATILLETCGTGGTQPLAGTHAAINFTFSPVPPEGATADDLGTIYFESPYLMKYGGEYILDEDSSTYYANWSYSAGTNDEVEADYDGTMTMLMTETGYAEITYEFDSGATDTFSNELDTIGESGQWEITFHTADFGWSETFTVVWILVEQ